MANSVPWRGQDAKAWLGAELTKKQVTVELDAKQLAAIDELMASIKARGLAYRDITAADFKHPQLDAFLADVLNEIKNGRGLVVLRPLPVDRYSLEDVEKIYWGIGTHFGAPRSQSTSGDLIGHVTNRGSSRGYNNARELPMHVDSAEIVGLLCVHQAKQGGENVLASAQAMYDIIKKERPDLLPILERGYRYHRRGEEASGDEPISPYSVPVFSTVDGIMSCRYSRERIDLAARDLKQPLTPLETEAFDFFEALAFRADVRFDLTMEPGEVLFSSNFDMLHSRTGFVDWDEPDRKRLILRLWLEDSPPRPLRREVFTYQNRSGHQGIDAQADRQAGRMEFLAIEKGKKLVDG